MLKQLTLTDINVSFFFFTNISIMVLSVIVLI